MHFELHPIHMTCEPAAFSMESLHIYAEQRQCKIERVLCIFWALWGGSDANSQLLPSMGTHLNRTCHQFWTQIQSEKKKKNSVGTGPTHTRKIKAPHQMYRSSSFSKTAAEGLKQPIYSRVNWTQPPLRDQLNHQPKPWWKVKPYSHWNVLALSLAICGETNSGVLCVLLQAFI